MKKLALILALMIIPCSAFGLEMLSDSTMDSVTGQAGVNIAMDDIQMFINIEKMAWIDCDGYNSWEGKATCGGKGGAIVLNNFQIDVLNINAITSTMDDVTLNNGLTLMSTTCGNIPLFYNYATSADGDGCQLSATGGVTGLQNLGLNNYYHYAKDTSSANNYMFVPHFLTIDVTDELPASTEGFQYWRTHSWTTASVVAGTAGAADVDSTVGGVLIGIPTMEIYINAMSFTPMYDGDLQGSPSDASNDDSAQVTTRNGGLQAASFGTIYMQGITFTTLSGWIEISPK